MPDLVWIPAGSAAGPIPPPVVSLVAAELGELAALIGLRDDEGGIRRGAVVEVLSRRWHGAGVVPAPDLHADGVHPQERLAVRVEAGRAWTNNDGLLAVLETAVDPDLSSLLLVVPVTYKGSACFTPVVQQLRRLLSGRGVSLDLTGVGVLGY